MQLRTADILVATKGRLVQGTAAAPFTDVSTDTRTIAQGEVFVAIRGDNFDAHEYVRTAAEAGAGAAVVERWPVDCPADLPVVLVDDSVRAYGQIAAWWRQQMPAQVVGITGSNGKTTTKEMVACLLRALGPTVATEANHNNQIGVPETLLRIRPRHRFAVVEMGSNQVGEIEYLASLTRPDVAAITNIGPSHLEAFGSEHGVQREKSALLKFLRPDGLAVFHAGDDDPWSRALAKAHHGRTATFGSGSDASWRAAEVREGARSVWFRLTRSPVSFFVPVVGAWQVDNCLAAIAVADELGLSVPEAAVRLRGFVAPDLRMALHQVGDLTIIVDCYNANPASMRAALRELARRPAKRRVAVLGDMLELGRVADAEHHAIGEVVGSLGIDLLCAVGERSGLVAQAAQRHGIAAAHVVATEHAAEASAWLREHIEPTDAVLVKGSRGLRLERVAEAIRAWAEEQCHGAGLGAPSALPAHAGAAFE